MTAVGTGADTSLPESSRISGVIACNVMSEPTPTTHEVLRALIGSGFSNIQVENTPNYHLFHATRVEQLGNQVSYDIAVAKDRFGPSDVEWLVKDTGRSGVSLILVGRIDQPPAGIATLTYVQFLDRLGGPILSLLPFNPQFGERLVALGHNTMPSGLAGGRADDLFEKYAHAGLQVMLRTRVIDYGQARRGEAVPDGIAVAPSIPLTLYDAKAYSNGYPAEMQGIRQFADYVDDYNNRYSSLVGPVTCFLVISGRFVQDEDALHERAIQFRAKCNASLAFLSAEVLAGIVQLLVREPLYRPSIDWNRVFQRHVIRLKDVETQLRARTKDGVLPRQVGP